MCKEQLKCAYRKYYHNGDILSGYKLIISDSEGSSSLHIVTFMYDENGEAFGFNYNGNDYYYVRNAQNDVVFITDSANNGVVMYQYDAWGNITACYDTSDNGMLSFANPYTYRGYYYEIETNTYFLKSRYYNPQLHRFICADGYVQTGQGVLDKNMFAYCMNNPMSYRDDNGTIAITTILACVASVAVAIATSVLISLLSRKDENEDIDVLGGVASSVIGQIPGGSIYNDVSSTKKTVNNIKKKKRKHAENVVNANHAKKHNKQFTTRNIEGTVFSSDEEYIKACLSASENIETVMQGAGVYIDGREWNSLSTREQDEIVNCLWAWDPYTEYNIDKNGSVICGFGMLP